MMALGGFAGWQALRGEYFDLSPFSLDTVGALSVILVMACADMFASRSCEEGLFANNYDSIVVRIILNGFSFGLYWNQLTTLLHGLYFPSLPDGDEANREANEVQDQANNEVD